MASENETVESVIQDMRGERYAVSGMPDLHMRDYAYRIESAWRREKAELRLAIDAEKARHTETYKDERIRAQDDEIRTLKKELTELRECLKEAIDYNCATCKSKGKACDVEGFCAEHRWRKVLEGANAPVAEGGES